MTDPLIPGVDFTLGERTGSEDFDYRDPRCGCGCALVWDDGDHGWHCPHCDLPPAQQPAALLDRLPPPAGDPR